MGACISPGIRIKVKCKKQSAELTGIADYVILRMKIQETLRIGPSFDLFVKGKLVASMDDYRRLLDKKSIKIIVKEKQVELIPPPVKPVAVAAKIEVKAHKKVSNCLYPLVDKTEAQMFSTMLISKCYLVVHKRYVPKNPASLFFHTKSNPKEKMDPILELECFWLYKLNTKTHPSLSRKFCRKFERKGKILGDPVIELKQDFNNLSLYRSPEYLSTNYLGFPVFYRHNLLGYIAKVQDDNITLFSAYDLIWEIIPSTIKSTGNVEKRERFPPKPPLELIKYHPEPDPPDQIDLEYDRRVLQEKEDPYFDPQEINELEISLNLDIGQSSPESFAYGYFNGVLIMYSNRTFKPKLIKIELPDDPSLTLTNFTDGIIAVYQQDSWIIGENGKKPLRTLLSSHVNHGAVWHKSKIYIIGGTNSNKVEYFEFPLSEEFEENVWVKAPDLPAIKESFGLCSVGEYIYVMGGKEESGPSDAVYRLMIKDWEVLPWTLPQRLEGIAAVFYNKQFVVFGGRSKVMINRKFYVLDEDGNVKIMKDMPMFGNFSGRSIGFADDIFFVVATKNKALEFHGNAFKAIVTEY